MQPSSGTRQHSFSVKAVLLLCILWQARPEPVWAAKRETVVLTLPALQPGTTLPVYLGKTLQAGKTKAGTVFTVTTTQRVPVTAEGGYLKRGLAINGEVTASQAAAAGQPALLAVRFTEAHSREQSLPLRADTVAIATLLAVSDTYTPASDPSDRGNPSAANWTTRQVGGDEVYRSGWVGDVDDTVMRKVGFADYNGVYRLPRGEGANGKAALPQAMGAFSTTAKGLYGFDDGVQMNSSGGVLTLTGTKGVALKRGDNLLLQVVP